MVEAWNGGGLCLGTGGTANPDRPIVFATGREEVARFTGGNLGTRTPTERLTVRGRILAEELVLRPTVWPGFVSGPGYRLMPLPELAAFVEAHRHLPGVPSAKEVAERGLAVAASQAALLRQVEERTLHVIALDRCVAEREAAHRVELARGE